MRVAVETLIDVSAEEVWARVRTLPLLEHVSAPLIRFAPVDPPVPPTVLADGDYRVSMQLFGVIPMGEQVIGVRFLETLSWPRKLLDDGHSALVSRWYHLIEVWPEGEGRAGYRDSVDIEAGLLTPLVWLFAQLLYRHRQRRWRALARDGFRALG
jgi:hypothetical protein